MLKGVISCPGQHASFNNKQKNKQTSHCSRLVLNSTEDHAFDTSIVYILCEFVMCLNTAIIYFHVDKTCKGGKVFEREVFEVFREYRNGTLA